MRKTTLITLLVFVLGAFLTGCGPTQQTQQPQQTPEKTTSIKIGGSSTLAPVIAKCADDFTEAFKTWNKVDPKLPEEPIVIFVSTGGSGFGIKATVDKTVDIGLTAREVKESEKEKIPQGKIFKVGSDVLTMAVHPENPVLKVKPDLTTAEIKSIFAGEIKTWQQLDPRLPDRPVAVMVRDLGGGASQVFDETVMKGTPIAKDALQIPSMGALAAKVMDNPAAIGYVSSGMVNQNQGKIAVLSVDGIAPTTENITSGKYKIARPLLMVTKDQPDTRQQLFIDYMLSAKGLKVVEEMGFVPPAK